MRSPIALVAFALVIAAPTVAAAQPGSNPYLEPRIGLFGGFSLQAGNMECSGNNCNDFRKAGGFDAHVGWNFNPRLGMIFDVYVLTSKENNLQITQTIATIGVRYWLAPILWVQAGLGGARADFSYDAGVLGNFNASAQNAGGFTAAIGLELLRGRRFSLDVEGRLGWGFYGQDSNGNPNNTGRNTSIGVGFTWF